MCDCSGQMPAEADFNLLDTARKVEVYGIRMHQAKVCHIIELMMRPVNGIFCNSILQSGM